MRIWLSLVFAHADVLVRLIFAMSWLSGETGFRERFRRGVVNLFAAGATSRAWSQDG